jgi:hypothetical protein
MANSTIYQTTGQATGVSDLRQKTEEMFAKDSTVKKRAYTVHPTPFPNEVAGSRQFSNKFLVGSLLLAPALPFYFFSVFAYWTYPIFFVLAALPTYMAYMFLDSYLSSLGYLGQVKKVFKSGVRDSRDCLAHLLRR